MQRRQLLEIIIIASLFANSVFLTYCLGYIFFYNKITLFESVRWIISIEFPLAIVFLGGSLCLLTFKIWKITEKQMNNRN